MKNPQFGAMVAAMTVFLLIMIGFIHPPGHEITTFLPPPGYNRTIMDTYHEEFPEKLTYTISVVILAVVIGFLIGYVYDLCRR
ncbi:hypothetical protein KY312_03115 [Candidatus Woesearchaeota archaeon]|nr:hypothetical protein [Candidatus Woesearchaeota archaeon]